MAQTEQHLKIGDALWSMDRRVGIITELETETVYRNVLVVWFIHGKTVERIISFENALDMRQRYLKLSEWVKKGIKDI